MADPRPFIPKPLKAAAERMVAEAVRAGRPDPLKALARRAAGATRALLEAGVDHETIRFRVPQELGLGDHRRPDYRQVAAAIAEAALEAVLTEGPPPDLSKALKPLPPDHPSWGSVSAAVTITEKSGRPSGRRR